MTTTNTFGIVFYLKKQKEKKAKAPIYARITVDGKRAAVSIKKDIDIENWSKGKGMAKGKGEEIKALNTYLEQIRSRIVECYQHLQLKNQLITAEGVKNKYLGIEEKEHSLINAFIYHNSEMEKELEPGTQKNYHTTKKYVENFLKDERHTTDIFLSQLNYKFVTDFEKFVKNNPLNPNKPCTQNGTMKHIERLKKVVNLSIKNEWLDKDPFIKYTSHFVKKERGYLTDFELESIEMKDFSIKRLQFVKDLFVFSCYTGLAYIEVMKLTAENIRRGIDREYWIFTTRKKNRNKTLVEAKIPLLPKAKSIIDKYKNDPEAIKDRKLFPKISNQKLNSYLKEIADVCNIEKELTFHLARHTFATTITLTNGVPLESVSKMLGHSSTTTTEIYAKVVEQKISNEMQELRKKLTNKTIQNMPEYIDMVI